MKRILICKGYFICEKPGVPPLFSQDGVLLKPKFNDWDHVFWGVPGQKLGRLPTALRMADELDVSALIFTIGSARLETGQSEADRIMEYVLGCRKRLTSDFPSAFNNGYRFKSELAFMGWLNKVMVFETEGHNTASSLRSAMSIVADVLKGEDGILLVVSSKNHSSRVLRDTELAVQASSLGQRLTVGVLDADTSYGGKDVEDVVIHDLGDPSHKPWKQG